MNAAVTERPDPPGRRAPWSTGAVYALGSLVGAVVIFLLFTGVGVLAGGDVGTSAVFGAFLAFWGGPGFGGTVAAAAYGGGGHD